MKEFKLDKIKATGTTVGDLHFPKVRLLLPLDGSNGATATSDSSNDNRTITFVGSDSEISTAQSKFGGSSLSITGGSSRITTAGTSNLSATGDFTMEVWIYNSSTSDYPCLITNGASSNELSLYLASTTSNQILRMWNNGSVTNFSTTLPQNQWYHFALVRSGSTVKLYVNGTADSTTRSDSGTYGWGSQSNLHIGGYPTRTDYNFEGYLDDFRLTIGQARYTTNFTPPTTAHLTSAGDVNKHIVVNSGADGVAIGTGGINQARVAKAWCNWDQTGTIAIRSSYNISSITDTATGRTDVNFSTAMTDTNYSAVGYGNHSSSASAAGNFAAHQALGLHMRTTNDIEVACYKDGTGYIDSKQADVIIFGN
jgi:hypothetical protein